MLANEDRFEPGVRVVADDVLVAGVVRGDHGSLAALYGRYGARVHSLADRICGPARADDVVQEVFVGLWRSPRRYDPARGSLLAFLVAQAHARAIEVHRRDPNERSREWMESVRRRTSDRSDVSGGVHRRDAVSCLLLTLPRCERDALTLAYFGGFTYGEVAWLLQQPDGVVNSWIRSGLTRLRMELASPTSGARVGAALRTSVSARISTRDSSVQ